MAEPFKLDERTEEFRRRGVAEDVLAAIRSAYETGYEEGASNEWASVEAVLDEFGEQALIDFVRKRIAE